MAFEYISVEEAMQRDGLRMVVVGGTPSPWGEAAKGLLHIKKIDWAAVRLDHGSEVLSAWAGQQGGPVAFYNNEKPRSGWAEILLLTERLAPTPPLLPAHPADRALVMGLAHELLGEEGLGWSRRLQLVHAGLQGTGGFKEPVAKFLAAKYGYRSDTNPANGIRVASLLRMLAGRLAVQREAGSSYYVGHSLSAADIYSATIMALFRPLPQEQCEMRASTRAAFETLDAETKAALHPALIEHRDMIYAQHLELPLSL
ncbi:MAG: hypothetical protein P1V21_15110 [Rhizobiaceae bacterium]|nr:hypothetical protein [Rhizobiaceae bacterium]